MSIEDRDVQAQHGEFGENHAEDVDECDGEKELGPCLDHDRVDSYDSRLMEAYAAIAHVSCITSSSSEHSSDREAGEVPIATDINAT